MKISTSLLVTAATALSTTANAFFVVTPNAMTTTTTTTTPQTTSLNMGLLDFFSPEAKAERDRKKQAQIEEQERLQKAIMERRKNPELMEEYEYKVQQRRELKMKGDFDAAKTVDVYEGIVDKQTLLDGTEVKSAEDN